MMVFRINQTYCHPNLHTSAKLEVNGPKRRCQEIGSFVIPLTFVPPYVSISQFCSFSFSSCAFEDTLPSLWHQCKCENYAFGKTLCRTFNISRTNLDVENTIPVKKGGIMYERWATGWRRNRRKKVQRRVPRTKEAG